jgi:hypothetical protein
MLLHHWYTGGREPAHAVIIIVDYIFDRSVAMKGLCADTDEPDLWFTQLDRGKPSDRKNQEIANEVSRAIAICNKCPIKKECYQEGLRPVNILYGIWGGVMAGDRLRHAGYSEKDFHPQTEPGLAFKLSNVIKPLLKG